MEAVVHRSRVKFAGPKQPSWDLSCKHARGGLGACVLSASTGSACVSAAAAACCRSTHMDWDTRRMGGPAPEFFTAKSATSLSCVTGHRGKAKRKDSHVIVMWRVWWGWR